MPKINDNATGRQNELRMLVRSLTNAEITRVKHYWRSQSKKKELLHLNLFELLTATPYYNDEELCELIKVNKGAQFSALKKKLFEDIVEQCTLLHSRLPVNQNKLGVVFFLLDRQLYRATARYLKSFQEEAYRVGDFDDYIKLLRTEHDCSEYLYPAQINEVQQEFQQKISGAIRERFLFDRLSAMFRQIVHLRNESNNRISDEELKEVEQRLEQLLDLNPPAEAHPINKIIYSTSYSLLAYLRHDVQSSSRHNKIVIKEWEENSWLVKNYSRIFFTSAMTSFYNKFARQSVDDVMIFLNRYDKLAAFLADEGNRSRWKVIHYHTTIKYYHKTRDYEKLKELVKNRKNLGELAESLFPLRSYYPFLTTDIITWFVLEEYEKADEAMYRIKNLNQDGGRQDIYYFSLLFHLLIMFELKDWYRLYLSVDAAYRQLHKKKEIRPFEKEVMLFLKKLPGLHRSREVPKIAETFLKKLRSYKDDPVKKQYFLYFDYYAWFESKLNNMHYTDYQRRNKKTPA